MVLLPEEIDRLEIKFSGCQKTLTALGDEVRQHLLILMVQAHASGIRVSDLAENTALSRPAVSHHLQILKDAGIVKSRKTGRFIYYYFDPDVKQLLALQELLEDVKTTIVKSMEAPET